MIDDFYQAALAALRHHLDEAGVAYTVDDGELVDRLATAWACRSLSKDSSRRATTRWRRSTSRFMSTATMATAFASARWAWAPIAPAAMHEAVSEWHLLAVAPLLAAPGAPVENRRSASAPQKLAGWDLFAGRVASAAECPPELRAGEAFLSLPAGAAATGRGRLGTPSRFELAIHFFMATCGAERSRDPGRRRRHCQRGA